MAFSSNSQRCLCKAFANCAIARINLNARIFNDLGFYWATVPRWFCTVFRQSTGFDTESGRVNMGKMPNTATQFMVPKISPVVKILLISCAVLFVLQLLLQAGLGWNLTQYLGFAPARLLDGWIWQPFTYAFLHSGPVHLLFNLLVIWSMGSELEWRWGSGRFALYYGICVLGAATMYAIFCLTGISSWGTSYPVIGSSGAVYGLLMAYGILFGDRILYFFMIFPMQARYFVLILGAVELVSSIFYGNSGVAHMAHLGGMLSGFVALWGMAAWNRRQRGEGGGKKRSKKSSHLRLVQEKDEGPSDPKQWH